MDGAVRGILAWSVTFLLLWRVVPGLAQTELSSDAPGFIFWLLEYAWIGWIGFGAFMVAAIALQAARRS